MDIKELLELTITRGASDLHLVPEYIPTIRVNGELFPLNSYPVMSQQISEQIFLPILSDEQKENLHVNREIDFGYNHGNHRFRVNIYFSKGFLGASFRLIPERIKTIEELGLPTTLRDLIINKNDGQVLKQGFILVTGPTGEVNQRHSPR